MSPGRADTVNTSEDRGGPGREACECYPTAVRSNGKTRLVCEADRTPAVPMADDRTCETAGGAAFASIAHPDERRPQ